MAGWIIEMVGNFGAGKTAIANHIAADRVEVSAPGPLLKTELGGGGMLWGRRLAITVDALLASSKSPLLTLGLARFLAAAKPGLSRGGQTVVLASWMVRLSRVRPKEGNFLILDDGIVHRLARLAAPGPTPEPSDILKKAMPGRIDALIHVDCDQEIAYARMKAREAPFAEMATWPDDVAQPAHARVARLIARAIAAARQAGLPVLVVDTSKVPPEDNAQIIRHWLARL